MCAVGEFETNLHNPLFWIFNACGYDLRCILSINYPTLVWSESYKATFINDAANWKQVLCDSRDIQNITYRIISPLNWKDTFPSTPWDWPPADLTFEVSIPWIFLMLVTSHVTCLDAPRSMYLSLSIVLVSIDSMAASNMSATSLDPWLSSFWRSWLAVVERALVSCFFEGNGSL